MIKLSPVKCNHCGNSGFLVFDYLENCLVLQCTTCKMVYGHQYDTGLYKEMELPNESKCI